MVRSWLLNPQTCDQASVATAIMSCFELIEIKIKDLTFSVPLVVHCLCGSRVNYVTFSVKFILMLSWLCLLIAYILCSVAVSVQVHWLHGTVSVMDCCSARSIIGGGSMKHATTVPFALLVQSWWAHITRLTSPHLASSHLTSFHFNWVCCDWLQLRQTGLSGVKWPNLPWQWPTTLYLRVTSLLCTCYPLYHLIWYRHQ